MKEKVAQTLQKGNEWPHSDAAVWEENLRAELAKTQIMLDRGEISDEEYLIQSEFLLERYREIERKYHSSDTEVIYDYQDYSNFPYYDYR